MMGWEFPPDGASPVWLFGQKAAGRVALVDDADFDLIRQFPWTVFEVEATPTRRSLGPYAVTSVISLTGKRVNLYMHRLLTKWPITDHINHNGLDNRRSNLRPATPGQNAANRRRRIDSSSRFKGVSYLRKRRKWQAQICVGGERKYLGIYATDVQAAHVYDAAAIHHFGAFACVNFPAADGAQSAALEATGT